MKRLSRNRAVLLRWQRAFTLIEVLIAMLVLSIGLLGVAGLQTVALRSTHASSLVSQASVLAYDIADRIRANPNEPAAYAGFETVCPEALPTTPLVSADLAEWSCAVEALLPSGVGRIVQSVNGAVTRYTITIEWRDARFDEDDDPWSFELAIEI